METWKLRSQRSTTVGESCMRLAAISDYPTREPIQLESDELTRLIEALAKGLDNLATSLEMGTDPGRLSDHSEFFEWPEKSLQEARHDLQRYPT